MVRRIVIVLALVLVGAGCADNILKERPVAQASKAPAPKASFSTSATGQSTVCGAYRRQLRGVRLALRGPSAAMREKLKGRELALQALIADACE